MMPFKRPQTPVVPTPSADGERITNFQPSMPNSQYPILNFQFSIPLPVLPGDVGNTPNVIVSGDGSQWSIRYLISSSPTAPAHFPPSLFSLPPFPFSRRLLERFLAGRGSATVEGRRRERYTTWLACGVLGFIPPVGGFSLSTGRLRLPGRRRCVPIHELEPAPQTSPAQLQVSLTMTIDKSLKIRAGMIRTRNVLKRAERLERLMAAERWHEGDPVLGLPKVRVQKVTLKKKKKVKKQEDES